MQNRNDNFPKIIPKKIGIEIDMVFCEIWLEKHVLVLNVYVSV